MRGDKYFVSNNKKAPEEIRGKVVVEQYRLKYCTCVKDFRGGYYKVSNKCLKPQFIVRGYKGYVVSDKKDKITGLTITMLIPKRNIISAYMFLDVKENEIECLSEPF